MKKLLTILLVLISLTGYSQITMETKSVLTTVANEWQFVKAYTNFVTENIPISEDSVMYSFYKIPNEIKERIFEIKSEQIGDTIFQYTDRARVDLTYGRRLVVYQYVRKHVYKEVERSTTEQLLFYLEKGKELGINNTQFYNYAPIDTIVNNIQIPVTDTIPE